MPSQSSSTEHVRRRASAAAAAEASEIRPINAKKAGKRPARPAKADRASAPASSGTAAAESNDALPTFDTAAEGLPIAANKASEPPAVPPGPLPRNERGEPSLLQERAGIDADENYGSQEYALSSYLKLHPVLSLESTSCQTLQLVANLVADASIPTKELEIVPKPHDDAYLRCLWLHPLRSWLARACLQTANSTLVAFLHAQAAQCGHRRAAVLLRRPVHLRVDGALALRRQHGHGLSACIKGNLTCRTPCVQLLLTVAKVGND